MCRRRGHEFSEILSNAFFLFHTRIVRSNVEVINAEALPLPQPGVPIRLVCIPCALRCHLRRKRNSIRLSHVAQECGRGLQHI